MKKLSLILLASVFTLSIYSCRETEERTDDSLQEVETYETEGVETYEAQEVENVGTDEVEVEETDDLQ